MKAIMKGQSSGRLAIVILTVVLIWYSHGNRKNGEQDFSSVVVFSPSMLFAASGAENSESQEFSNQSEKKPKGKSERNKEKEPGNKVKDKVKVEKIGDEVKVEQVGEASWYGKYHHGKKTATGEKFDHHDLTAAHPTLPLGTEATVTNLETGKSVNVEINDRGPYRTGKEIDLSREAAKEIGAKEDGVAPVKIETTLPAEHPAAADPSALEEKIKEKKQLKDPNEEKKTKE